MLDLEAIRERHAQTMVGDKQLNARSGPDLYERCAADVPALIAEVERLRHDVQILRDGGDLDAVNAFIGEQAECKHERATFDHMLDETRQVYKCDDCGWEHFTAVDHVTEDIVNVDARTGEIQAHR